MKEENIASRAVARKEYKFFSMLVSIYVTLGVTSVALGYKVVEFHSVIISGAAFILPFRYLLGGMISDIYPQNLAKKQIWNLLLACLIFSLLSKLVIYLPSPTHWQHETSYIFVLGNALRITLIAAFGLIIGVSLNMFIVKKLGCKYQFKFFGLRVFASTTLGELLQYVIVLPLIFWGKLPFDKIVTLILFDYVFQVIFISVLTPFFSVFRSIINKAEIEITKDNKITFNPFKLS